MIDTVDYHTGREPFRIVPAPPVALPGATAAERRMHAQVPGSPPDELRRLLVSEPRGHADMYGGFLVPPDDEGAHLGVLFWHADGFSTACGHGMMALGAWAIETGRVQRCAEGPTEVVIDVPSGRVRALVHTEASGTVTGVDFANVASCRMHTGVELATSRGRSSVDIGFGGALYAHVRASDLGLAVDAAHLPELIALGREIKALLTGTSAAAFPADDRLAGIYGVIFYDEIGATGAGVHQRNVTIFADGQVDRSPCGSGTASRVAVLAAAGRLTAGQTLTHDSIVGSRFTASYRHTASVPVGLPGRPALPGVLPVITGTAHRTGTHSFTVDPRDPLVPGFVLR
ncbi:proline racemase family protein [Brevibacterium gallinarum]|uniref:Proline racemase family protein n=1 Tax=Brevibacterium gallinarum TaxID=2762220 RepID=A0ABR8WS24_9MICO|nr:proline racemase family protein [Brevibacterium gallinarum]MBD8019692.1 proline racemase family protein [Brevibacterium gallinarum]